MEATETESNCDRRSMLIGSAAMFAGLSWTATGFATPADQPNRGTTTKVGPINTPTYFDRIDHKDDVFGYKQKNYSYMSAKGPVIGLVSSLTCTIDRSSRDVWPFLKDFNSFEGPSVMRWEGMDGELIAMGDLYNDENHDLGHQTLTYGGANSTLRSVPTRVIRVIPEHLIVIFETIPADGSSDGISPGFHVIMLNEHKGISHVAMIFEHAERLKYATEAEAMENSRWGPKKFDYSITVARWKEFVPKLKGLIYTASPAK